MGQFHYYMHSQNVLKYFFQEKKLFYCAQYGFRREHSMGVSVLEQSEN